LRASYAVYEHPLWITIRCALYGACQASVTIGGSGDIAAERNVSVELDKVVARTEPSAGLNAVPAHESAIGVDVGPQSRPISLESLLSSLSAFRLATFVWELIFKGGPESTLKLRAGPALYEPVTLGTVLAASPSVNGTPLASKAMDATPNTKASITVRPTRNTVALPTHTTFAAAVQIMWPSPSLWKGESLSRRPAILVT
jgi:hypothetical protein